MNNGVVAILLGSLLDEHLPIMMQFPRQMNQYQGIASAMARSSVYYPTIAATAEATKVGWSRLEQWTRREIYPDGSVAECSPNYGLGCVERLHDLIQTARQHGHHVPVVMDERMQAAVQYYALTSDPLGRSPRIAKGGGAICDRLASLNEVYRDPVVAYVTSKQRTDQPLPSLMHAFPWAGHIVMRSDWSDQATWLFFDAGPRGSGHHDVAQLGIQLITNGQMLLTDPGFYSYSGRGEAGRIARYLHSTAAHNTGLVNGHMQNRTAPGVSPGPNDEPGVYHARRDSVRLRAQGTYTYGFGPEGAIAVSHWRDLQFSPGRHKLVVEDVFQDDAAYECTLHWQFAPGAVVEAGPGGAIVRNREGVGMTLNVECSRSTRITYHEGKREPYRGWFSAHYGQLETAPMIAVTATGELPLHFKTHINIHRKNV